MMKILKTLINVGFVIMFYVEGDVKVKDHCHITGKYRGSAHRVCNINVELNHKISILFHNLKNYDSHLIMQELGKINFETNVIPNGLGKYMSFNINNKLIFIESFQFLSSSLDSLVKGLGKNGFKYLSQEFDSKVLDLAKQKGFHPDEYMSDFEKFKEELTSKENFYSFLTGKKLVIKSELVLKIWGKFDMETMKNYNNF